MAWILALLVSGVAWAAETPTGIALDTQWKREAYEFAQKNLVHPSWGLAHSERNYQVTRQIAAREGVVLDLDALFAAAFLHDVGGLEPHAKEGVDHAVRSVEVAEPLLRQWGFPMEKWSAVRDLIVGHTYYTDAPVSPQARVFRDADVLDFLGAIGIARILAVTLDPDFKDGTLKPTVGTLEAFERTMSDKCVTPTCRELALPRKAELTDFLQKLRAQSFDGRAL